MPDTPISKFFPEHITFDKLIVGVDATVSQSVLDDLAAQHRDMPMRMSTVTSQLGVVSTHMIFSLRTWLLKSRHVDERTTTTISVPATAWDHVKHDMLLSGKRWVVWLAVLLTPSSPKKKSMRPASAHITIPTFQGASSTLTTCCGGTMQLQLMSDLSEIALGLAFLAWILSKIKWW